MLLRLQSKNHDEVFQIVEVHGDGPEAKSYTLSDLSGKRDHLGFAQPVTLDRLTPVEMLPLAHASDEDRTRLAVYVGNESREGTITAQSLDGKVYVRFDGDSEDSCVDLATAKYQWL